MFVGHLAAALGAKRVEPRIPLGLLVAAAFGLDLVWPLFLLAGVERVRVAPGDTAFTPLAFEHYPWSHSLLLALLWGAAVFAFARWRTLPARSALVLGTLVLSHWVLDAVVHRPDLPLWPGASPLVGFALWNSVPFTVLIEGLLFLAGIALYVRTMGRGSGRAVAALWSLVFLTTALWLAGPFGPPPPSARAVALGSLALWLLPPWAEWSERLRARARHPGSGTRRIA